MLIALFGEDAVFPSFPEETARRTRRIRICRSCPCCRRRRRRRRRHRLYTTSFLFLFLFLVVVPPQKQAPPLRVEDLLELLGVDGSSWPRARHVPVRELVEHGPVAGEGASDDGGKLAKAVDEAFFFEFFESLVVSFFFFRFFAVRSNG